MAFVFENTPQKAAGNPIPHLDVPGEKVPFQQLFPKNSATVAGEFKT